MEANKAIYIVVADDGTSKLHGFESMPNSCIDFKISTSVNKIDTFSTYCLMGRFTRVYGK